MGTCGQRKPRETKRIPPKKQIMLTRSEASSELFMKSRYISFIDFFDTGSVCDLG